VANSEKPPRRISLDTYAVLLAIALAILVRLDWVPAVKW
jgi:hypothetical protein